jgi:hypothetical protein
MVAQVQARWRVAGGKGDKMSGLARSAAGEQCTVVQQSGALNVQNKEFAISESDNNKHCVRLSRVTRGTREISRGDMQ